MRVLIVLILLAFPVAEIWLLIELGQRYGVWLLFYLVAIGLLGLRLIRDEKLLLSGRVLQSLTAGGNPMKAMFGSARNIFAGVLLIIPGLITDIIAVTLLFIPIKHSKLKGSKTTAHTYESGKAANDDVIEGEFHRDE